MRRFLIRVFNFCIRQLTITPSQIKVTVPVLDSKLLEGRRALITGGGSGIGYAIARAFLKAGASVVIAGRNSDRLKKAREELSHYGDVKECILDVCKVDGLEHTLSALGFVDILVNNAGYVGGGILGETAERDYDLAMDTNLKGAYFISQIMSRRWIEGGLRANILNLCSASSLRPGTSPYILSKTGLRSLTVGLAKKLTRHDIVVNGLAPGCTDTDQFRSMKYGIANPRNPAGRMVTTEEIGNLAVILVSDLCRMVIGDVLYVTGGAGITTFDD